MTERQTPTEVQQEIQTLKQALRGPIEAREYFAQSTTDMQAAVSTADERLLRYTYDLLTRNLVNAFNNTDEAVTREVIGDSCSAVIVGGGQLFGRSDEETMSRLEHSHEAITDLQVEFNGKKPFVNTDTPLHIGFIGTLMTANAQLLAGSQRYRFTDHTSTDYYCGNIAVAKLRLTRR